MRSSSQKKREFVDARLAFWFGVAPSGLGPSEKRAWLALLPQLQAERLIVEGDLSGFELDQLEALKLTATGGDSEAARQFKMRAYAARLLAASGRRAE